MRAPSRSEAFAAVESSGESDGFQRRRDFEHLTLEAPGLRGRVWDTGAQTPERFGDASLPFRQQFFGSVDAHVALLRVGFPRPRMEDEDLRRRDGSPDPQVVTPRREVRLDLRSFVRRTLGV